MNPFISIVITTHHRHELLERALDSIYKQDFDEEKQHQEEHDVAERGGADLARHS